MSVAQAIQESITSQQLLYTAQRLWLPTDPDLPLHIQTQKIHHDKRMKAASMLLYKLGDCIGGEYGVELNYDLWNIPTGNGRTGDTIHSLKRAILASSMDFATHDFKDEKLRREHVDSNHVCMALLGLHSIIGYTLPLSSALASAPLAVPRNHDKKSQESINVVDGDILRGITTLIEKAESIAWDIPMHQAVEVRWAIRGILARLGAPLYGLLLNRDLNSERDASGGVGEGGGSILQNIKHYSLSNSKTCFKSLSSLVIPNLQERTKRLPFDILPLCLDWNSLEEFQGGQKNDIVKSLLREIPFHFDTITTRNGSKVEERRGTAWVAEEGIGSLAYSGKLMVSRPMPEIVYRVMRQIEKGILDHEENEKLQLCCETIGKYFDCALCNHYPNEASKCKFHTDPEHGTYWERLTCVVSAGNRDVRKFAFRPIPNENEWARYETEKAIERGINSRKDDAILPAVIPLFPGDVVKMDRECNDLFHHAVYGRQDAILDETKKFNSVYNDGNGGRVSLVLKRAMDHGNGRKGHGKAGEGRRSKGSK